MDRQLAPTFAEIRRILKETALAQKKHDIEMREIREIQKETDRQMKETDRQMKETDRQMKETDKKIDKVFGTFSNNWDKLVESLVEGDLLKKLAEKGIKIDGTASRVKGVIKATKAQEEDKECEIDILARNGKEVVALEVKSDCNKKDVDHFLDVLRDFTRYFREYRDKVVYGAIAYLRVQQGADKYAEKKGLFVIKATGNSSRITNKANFKPKDFS